MRSTIQLGVQTREATVEADSADAKERTVDVVWSTGASVKRGGLWSDPYIEELDMSPSSVRMGRLQSGNAPVLDSHNSWGLDGVIGIVKSASVTSGEGRATLRFSKRESVTPIWTDVQDGIIRNISVGYRVHKAVKVETADAKIPTVRIVDWEPMEISLVPIGADAKANVRKDETTTSCELEDSQEPPASGPGPAVGLLRLALEIEGEAI